MKPVPAGFEKAAVLYIGALVWLPAYLLPYAVMSSMARFHLSEEHAGWLATGELLTLAVTVALVSRWIDAIDKRRGSLLACLSGLAATVGMLLAQDLATVVALKLLFGASLGLQVACAYGLASYYRHPEKLFAQIAMTMAPLFAVVMTVVPMLITRHGPIGAELVQLVMMGLGVLAALRMPVARAARPGPAVQAETGARAPLPRAALWMLLGVLALFTSQTVTMGFAGAASQARGISEDTLGQVFMVGALAQLPAALIAAWLQDRAGHFKPIAAGLLVLIGVALGMYCYGGVWAFYVAASLVNAGSTLSNPYMVAMLAQIDDSGRSTALAGSLTNVGLAMGPAFAGLALGQGGLQEVGWLAVLLLVVTLAAAWRACRPMPRPLMSPGLA